MEGDSWSGLVNRISTPAAAETYDDVMAQVLEFVPERLFIEALATTATGGDLAAFATANPILLAPVVDGFLELIGGRAGVAGQRWAGACVARLRALRSELSADPRRFPVGAGPLDALFRAALRGEIGFEYLERTAASEPMGVSPLYLEILLDGAGVYIHEDMWDKAVLLRQVVHAAVAAWPDGPYSRQLVVAAALADLPVTTWLLAEAPFWPFFQEAFDRVAKVKDLANASGDRLTAGRAMYGLGVMCLDACTAGLGRSDGEDLQQREVNWRRRLVAHFGEEVVTDLAAHDALDEIVMPSASECLKIANTTLSLAGALLSGVERGRALKALVQVMSWQQQLGDPIEVDHLFDAGRGAFEELDRVGDYAPLFSVVDILDRNEADLDIGCIPDLIDILIDDEDIPADTAMVGLKLARRHVTPVELAATMDTLAPRFTTAPDADRGAFLELRLKNLINAFALDIDIDTPQPPRPLLARLRTQAQHGHLLDDVDYAIRLLACAHLSPVGDDEQLGLALLDEALPLLPEEGAREHADSLTYFRARLLGNVAVNQIRAGAFNDALHSYSSALQCLLDLGLTQQAFAIFDKAIDMAAHSAAYCPALSGLAPLAARLDLVPNRAVPIDSQLQYACRRAIAHAWLSDIAADEQMAIWRMAKGQRFAVALASTAWREGTWHDEADRELAEIDSMQRTVAEAPPAAVAPWSLLDEQRLLSSYIELRARHPGYTPEERLANRYTVLDDLVTRRVLATGPDNISHQPLDGPAVRNLIGPATILVDLYTGSLPGQPSVLFAQVITQEESQVVTAPLRTSGPEVLSIGEHVANLRHALTLPSGPMSTSSEAEDILTADSRHMFAPLIGLLDLHASDGKNHVCVVPHGALHYYPLHLLGPLDEPLAQRFSITYLPSLHLLNRLPLHMPNRDGITVVGLGFAHDPRPELGPLPQAPAEAEAIAAAFSTTALLDDDATVSAVRNALTTSGYVHLATHGRHNVEAPAFQSIYLAPGTPGQLFAHEVLRLDLRGLKILTLSACETALGRFDESDNLRGLPAAFLLSGTETIIGTLWPVSDEASACFFTEFYRGLAGRLSRLDAFIGAQHATRAACPNYLDWGAFQLIGRYDD